MHRPLLVSIAAVMGLLVAHGPTMAQQAHCETSDWSFVLKKDAQEAAITVYDGAAERLFLFEISSAEGVSVSVSYKSGSGAVQTTTLQNGLPVYLEASNFNLNLIRDGQQGPDVIVKGRFGPCW